MVKKYSYQKDGNLILSEHFVVKEFASIGDNGKLYSDQVLIDSDLIDVMEKLYNFLDCTSIRVNSGYRTNEHEMSLSKNAVANGYHTKGQAVDINCYKGRKIITAEEIALALEYLGWQKGIGLISKNAVHIDTRATKYYFNEMNGCKSIGTSFFKFYGKSKDIFKDKEISKDLSDAIDKLSKVFGIDAKWWKEHYEDEYGMNAIKDLILKISKKL